MPDPVIVVGGGIAGIQAATDLAEMGVPVYLVESGPSLGGRMAQLDKTFPTNDCSTCILAPKITDCYTHENVSTYTMTEVVNLTGEPGDFQVKMKKKPRYVDEEKCTGCGDCFDKCPVTVEDDYNMGMDEYGAIHRYRPQSVPNVAVIDGENCRMIQEDKCGVCEKVCNFDAVDYEQKERKFTVKAASIIFAAGYESFPGDVVDEYRYGEHPNVVTSLEYERILNAAGPTDGHIVRPSDGEEADRIAFIHCSGSRDRRSDHNYCSSVCCMYSLKHAFISQEHRDNIDVDLYYMDIRSHGKGFERYYNRAEDTENINFIRSRVAEIEEGSNPGDVRLKVTDGDNGYTDSEYDLVVLASGMAPTDKMKNQLQNLNVRTNKYGFAANDEFDPLATSREGVYTCGVVNGPKDIPESVMGASGSAALAARHAVLDVKDLGFEEARIKEERIVENERTRVGVFVCHCGTNIAGVIDVEEVAEKAAKIPFVEHAEDVVYLCSSDSQDLIADRIEEYDLNRVVIASCTPRTHEPLFRDAVERSGLNPYLMEMTNIRDQGSWVHKEEPEKATWKAFELIKATVSSVKNAMPLQRGEVDNITRGLVIGGGISGMTSALELAKLGFPVSLVEKKEELGGHANKLKHSLQDRPVQPHLDKLKRQVRENELIDTYLGYELKDISGFVGNFQLELEPPVPREIEDEENLVEIEGGTVVVATGGQEHSPQEYEYEVSDSVITQLELEEKLKDDVPEAENIYMIQCVGSREEERPYCSRLCCSQALRNAIHIKERNPEAEITILYREMRSYGYYEGLYRRARNLGVNFSRFTQEDKPEVKAGQDGLEISYNEPLTDRQIEDEADLLVLAPAITPQEDNQEISQMLKTPLNEDDFFLQAHVKLRPVDSATDGIFLTGLAHGPKNLSESISQSRAAAGRAASILAREYLLTQAEVAEVNEDLCIGCGDCERVCVYSAIEVDPEDEVAEVNNVLCKGCGNCTGVCRPHAVDLKGFSNSKLIDEIDALLTEDEETAEPVETGGM